MPPAARTNDLTSHGPPLNPGPGSPDVLIGFLPAWRAIPAGMGAGIESASDTMNNLMTSPSLDPATTPAKLSQVFAALSQDTGTAASKGAPGAPAATSSSQATLMTANVALTATYTAAAAVPGGEPAARTAYTLAVQAAAAAAMSAAMSAMAGMADMHICPIPVPIPPHGPGFVTKGSKSVFINNLPACREGDKVFEAAGGSDPIAMGCQTVLIGDQGGGGSTGGGAGGGGAGGGGGGTGAGGPAAAAAQPQSTYAETAPAQPAVAGPPTQNVGTGTHWLEIEMVDEAEQPVVGERYTIRLPDAKEVSGGLNDKGQVRITGIQKPGSCQIHFSNLDMDAWHRWAPKPLPPPAGSTAPPQGGPDEGPVPKGPDQPGRGHWHSVLQGECMSSIGKDHGLFWSTIWNHPQNAELKRRRGNPNVLLPHDAVFIPNPRSKSEGGAIDQHHKFRRRGEPARLNVVIKDASGKPRSKEPYILEIDQRGIEGVTDKDGRIHVPIPGNARQAKLILVRTSEEIPLRLGHLDPIRELSGVQGRLNNLGFPCGEAKGVWRDKTEVAIRTFQKKHGLKVTGQCDDPTRARLLQEHGS